MSNFGKSTPKPSRISKTRSYGRRRKRYARFIEAHESEYLAERARTDWLRYAAQANDAKRFAALYPKLRWNREERDILCLR